MIKKIFIFGNIDLPNDSLPLRILPELEERFPNIQFEIKDPNEDWAIPSSIEDGRPNQAKLGFRDGGPDITIIDTVVGINEVTIFDSLEKFSAVPRVSVHDFDALTNLRLLQKIGKIKSVKIIGIPQDIDKSKAIKNITQIIDNF
jgi:hypothetical protein